MNLLEFSHYPFFAFKSEDELTMSQFFMSLSDEEKNEICAKVADAPAKGEIPSTVLKEEIKKKFNERRSKTMLPNTDYAKACAYASAFGYGAKNFENPIVNGTQFGPNDDVYLFVNGDKCQIYPKDETAKREVQPIRDLDIQKFMKTYQEKHGKRIPGGKINRLQKALAKWRRMLTPFSTKQFNGPVFDKIVFSGNATILIDTYGKNDKTVVKCMDGEPYDPEKALLTALFIREYGKNTYHDLMEICHEEYEKCGEPGVPHDPSVWLRSHSLASMAKSAVSTFQAFADSTKKTD